MKILQMVQTLIVASLFLISAHITFCQTEKLDVIKYTLPAGWAKTPKDGLMVYNTSDKNTGGFCLLTVYPSIASAGSPNKDLVNTWIEKVVKPFKVEANLKPNEGLKNNPLETVVYRRTIHYFEGIGEYALIMHPAHQTKRDGGFDYVLAFPDSYIYSRKK